MEIYAIQTAVDEACSNIIDHAYGGESEQPIVCACEADSDRFVIQLQDRGAAFQPEAVPSPDLVSDLENRQERGLGLYFMRRLMDEVHFEFSSEHGNSLTMVKCKAKKA